MKKFKRPAILALCLLLIVSMSGCVLPFGRSGDSSQDSSSLLKRIVNWIKDEIRSEIREEEIEEGKALESEPYNSESGDAAEKSEDSEITDKEESGDKNKSGTESGVSDKNEDEKKSAVADSSDDAEESGTSGKADASDIADASETKDSAEKTGSGSFMPEYYHYDKADFEKLVNAMKSAADDEEALEKAYEAAYQELLKIDDLYSSIYLKYSDDVNNEENDKEMNYTKLLLDDCYDLLASGCHELVADHEAFGEYLGPDLKSFFKGYEPMTEEMKKLHEREIDLVTDYYAEYNRLNTYSYEFNGKSYTFEDLESDAGADWAIMDAVGYMMAYNGIMKKFNETVGPIYLELVQIRDQIAKLEGYDNYAEYAYAKEFYRDYSIEDAEKFCEAVKTQIAPYYYEDLYYGGTLTPKVDYKSDLDELFEDLDYLANEISLMASSAYKRLTEDKLYDIGYESSRIESSYTGILSGSQTPYIFAHLDGGLYDFMTMTHEFGHFTYLDQSGESNYFLQNWSLDLMEIHSNGFELLCSKYYDRFFDDDADAVESYALSEILANVVSGCIQDEFQRKVYENPDITLDEMNSLYKDITSEYGEYIFGTGGYEWSLIPHNFESPLYYLSYAVSAVSSLEIWDIAQEDYHAGVEAWENVLKTTNENLGYLKTLEKCGLTPITDTDGVVRICSQAIETAAGESGQREYGGYREDRDGDRKAA